MDAQTALTALTVVAGLALLVERTLELLKHFIEFGNGTVNLGALRSRAEELMAAVEKGQALPDKPARSGAAAAAPPQPGPEALADVDAEPAERYAAPRIPLVPMAPLAVNETANAFFLQFFAAGLGIVLAHLFDLRLLNLFLGRAEYPVLDVAFTGLLIGGGSQPVHLLIRFISERKVEVPESELGDDPAKEIEKTKALARVVLASALVEQRKETQPLQWVDIPYAGGVTPARLQAVHKRSGPPTLIVYHHTAMSSSSSFQEVVDEFLVTKKWLTGYHCVIMPDGTIQPFCRWDRYGNHAKGVNERSLGISFHGNFHTDRRDPYSNADGMFGNQRPTEAQLHAGARVIALWMHLYGIAPDDVRPHRKVMPDGYTVCPGDQFPEKELEDLVRQYHAAWSGSAQARGAIDAFKQRDYVYA